jgi:hypothetical protein
MNQLDKNSYTLFLNSTDKVSGTNNNANYQVNWDDFLPRDIDNYKVVFSFQTAGGYYRDNFSQFKNTTVAPAPVQCTYQIATPAVYNALTNSTSLLISVLNNGPLLLNNYVTTGGRSFLITQQANNIGDTCIVQGNASYFPLNTTIYANFYTQLTCDTAGVNNYLGSLTVGQTINYNGSSYPIIKIGTAVGAGPYVVPPNTATVIVVMGVVYSAQIPNNAIVYASNNTTYNGCKIVANFLGQSKSFDTSSKCPSLTLGYGFRDVQISTSNSNCLSTFYMQNPPKTIQRPNQNLINIQIYNNSNVYTNGSLVQNQLLVNTDYFSNPLADMTSYSMIIEFIPLVKQ